MFTLSLIINVHLAFPMTLRSLTSPKSLQSTNLFHFSPWPMSQGPTFQQHKLQHPEALFTYLQFLQIKDNFSHFLPGYCKLLENFNADHLMQFHHGFPKCLQLFCHRPSFPFFPLSHLALLLFRGPTSPLLQTKHANQRGIYSKFMSLTVH